MILVNGLVQIIELDLTSGSYGSIFKRLVLIDMKLSAFEEVIEVIFLVHI